MSLFFQEEASNSVSFFLDPDIQMVSAPVVLVIPALGIALLSWVGTVFVLNRYRGIMRFTRIEMLSLLLFLLGGFAGWIAELCIVEKDLAALQITASLYRTAVNWFALLLIVNGRLIVTTQQIWSFVLTIVTTLLWEWKHRIII